MITAISTLLIKAWKIINTFLYIVHESAQVHIEQPSSKLESAKAQIELHSSKF